MKFIIFYNFSSISHYIEHGIHDLSPRNYICVWFSLSINFTKSDRFLSLQLNFNIDLFQGNVVSDNLLVVSEIEILIKQCNESCSPCTVPLVTDTATMIVVSIHVQVVITYYCVSR